MDFIDPQGHGQDLQIQDHKILTFSTLKKPLSRGKIEISDFCGRPRAGRIKCLNHRPRAS